jgi:hypothetical protein
LDEFKRIVSLAVLFKTAEALYGDLDYREYRAQTVTYAIAMLSHRLQRRLPWSDIWELQGVPPGLLLPLKTLMVAVREAMSHQSRNIGEWCKRPECWSHLLALQVEVKLPEGLADGPTSGATPIEALSGPERVLVEAVGAVPADVWFAVASWAKSTESLQGWQRSLAYSLGGLPGRSRKPSLKQATQGRKLLFEARRLGFGHELLASDLLARLAEAGSA